MATYFVSDFHLGERNRERDNLKLAQFDKFVERVGSDLTHLVVLGDLYDFWLEYRYLIPKQNLSILFKMHALVQKGVKVTYVCGNHDFWVGDFMSKELGFDLRNDGFTLDAEVGEVLVLHGDGIAPSDYKYRILKRILRNRVGIAIYRQLPTSLAYKLALAVSGTSRDYGEEKPTPEFVKEYHDFAKQKFGEGFFAVVCGHIHWPEIADYDGKFYVNCGDWLNYFSYVRFDGREFSLGSMKD